MATLFSVIGQEARAVYKTFRWGTMLDAKNIGPVLKQFEDHCQPRRNVTLERYQFNRRQQETGETYDQYQLALRQLAASCSFNLITPEEILRDRLVVGITDSKVREQLLWKKNLTLSETEKICFMTELTSQVRGIEMSERNIMSSPSSSAARVSLLE